MSYHVSRRSVIAVPGIVLAGLPLVPAGAAEAAPGPAPSPDLAPSPLDGGRAVTPPPGRGLPSQPPGPRLGDAPVTVPPLSFTFKANAYPVFTLPRERFPYRRGAPLPRVDAGVHDAAGVRMFALDGRLYDHPVGQASYGIDNLESYLLTEDRFFLDRAAAQAKRLTDRARQAGGAWYLPYPFDFELHGLASERLRTPWYSAMAQGQALTLFVRLFEVTQDQRYRNAADGIFASFLRPRATSAPWVVWVDAARYLWLEEYAGARPDRTFNGHMFATWGLWDYWRLTGDERAQTLIRGALTTIVGYFASFHRTNWQSHYCLSHPTVYSEKYHLIHIQQLATMYSITRTVAFARYAEMLSADYPAPVVRGPVLFSAGNFTGVKFDAKGRVTGRRTLAFPRATSAPADRRARIYGQPGLWYHITAGGFANYYVQEKPFRAVLQGRYLTAGWFPPRAAVLAAGVRYDGYTFSGSGVVENVTSVVPDEATPFEAATTAHWNGAAYVLADTGPLAGYWVPRAEVTI